MSPAPVVVPSDFAGIIGNNYEVQSASGFLARADLKPVKLVVPMDWDMDPFDDRNWSFQLHAWRMLPSIWGKFQATGDARYFDEAFSYVRDWYRFHCEERRESRFAWYDMSAGLRAQHLAYIMYLLDAGKAVLRDDDQTVLGALIELHLKYLRDESFINEGNHGVFQLYGLQLLSILSGNFARDDAYTSRLLIALVERQFTSQAVHTENSPYYHLFGIKIFSDIRPELFPRVAEKMATTVSKARKILPWLSFPDGAILNVGDSEGRGQAMKQEASHGAVHVSAKGRHYISKDLAKSGYVVVRTAPDTKADKARALYFVGSHFIDSHSHADELSFVYYHDGSPLFVDSGKYSYNKDQWREYFVSDHAHNLLVLEKARFLPGQTRLGGSALKYLVEDESGYRMKGVVRRRGGFQHTRTVAFVPDVRISIKDEIVTPVKQKRVALFHIAADAQAVVNDGYVDVIRRDRVVARIKPRGNPEKVDVVRGMGMPSPQGWFSPSYMKKEAASVVRIFYPETESSISTAIMLK